jgi:hypothetical protein
MLHQPIWRAHLLRSIYRSRVWPILWSRRWWRGGQGVGSHQHQLQPVENSESGMANHGGTAELSISYNHGMDDDAQLPISGPSQMHHAPLVVVGTDTTSLETGSGRRRLQSKVAASQPWCRWSLLELGRMSLRGLEGWVRRARFWMCGGFRRWSTDSEVGGTRSNRPGATG